MLNRKLLALLVLTFLAVVSGLAVATARSTDPSAVIEQQRASVQHGMPSESTFVRAVEDTFNGRTWEFGQNVSAIGDQCLELRSPVGWRSASCLPALEFFSKGPIYASTGGAGAISFLDGIASPAIKKLEVIRADCSRERLSLSADGLFLSVTSASAAAPAKVRGFDSSGKVVATQVLVGQGAGTLSRDC